MKDRALFWDRNNVPIENTLDWARKFEDDEYRTIAVDVDDLDNHTKMVSTIWHGLDRSLNLHATDETAMIFETAYLEGGMIQESWLDNNEEGARMRHRMVCLSMLGKEPDASGEARRRIIENGKRRKW